MLQLKNSTPFAAHIALFPDEHGVETLYVAVKATFLLKPQLAVAPQQSPISAADEYWGEPGASSLKYASEVHLAKRSTDVALVGHAWAPKERPVASLMVSLAVAGRKQTVLVTGDREWQPLLTPFLTSISAPAPFTSLPLTYERAFGGSHAHGDKPQQVRFEPRNPVGRGFAGKRRGRELAGLKLPNLEDPAAPVRKLSDRPAPNGFGFIAPSWDPRKSLAGTYDEAWTKTRCPYLPKDFDSRFFNAAHPNLVMPKFLVGGEPVEAVNVSREGSLSFRLPACSLTTRVQIAGRVEQPKLNLETVLLEPDRGTLALLWRAAVPCDKCALKIEQIELELDKLEFERSGR